MPRTHRLSHREFAGRPPVRRTHGAFFSVSVAPLSVGPARFTCTISKKVAPTAVARNLLKRRCREAARPCLARIATPVAIVVQAKKAATNATLALIREDIAKLLQSLQ